MILLMYIYLNNRLSQIERLGAINDGLVRPSKESELVLLGLCAVLLFTTSAAWLLGLWVTK